MDNLQHVLQHLLGLCVRVVGQIVHGIADEGDSPIGGHREMRIGFHRAEYVAVVWFGLLWLDLDVLLVLVQLISLSGSLIFFTWWGKGRWSPVLAVRASPPSAATIVMPSSFLALW